MQKKMSSLETLKQEFLLTDEKMGMISKDFISEMELGLQGKDSSLKMIPSYVTKLPDGTETGTYYALDLGGSNFRVSCFELLGDGRCEKVAEKKFEVPDAIMTSDNPNELFDFLADSVLALDTEDPHRELANKNYGFTFSFPVKQTAINKGFLIKWTKGFTVTGVEGKEIVQLLQEAIHRKQNEAKAGTTVASGRKIVALVNDTVGTLSSARYTDPDCKVGIIFGTGTNAAYVEKVERITKLFPDVASIPADVNEEMAINIEWGAFGDKRSMLPFAEADVLVDEQSVNPGFQRFEKMIAGFYLGEIARQVIVQLIEAKEIFQEPSTLATLEGSKLFSKHSLETRLISEIESDSVEGSQTQELLKNEFGISHLTADDVAKLREVCIFVVERAARLTACAIAAILERHSFDYHTDLSVGIDGSVFELHPTFSQRLSKALEGFGFKCNLFLTKDGSGKGAALIASGLQ